MPKLKKYIGFDQLINNFAITKGQTERESFDQLATMFPTKPGNQKVILDAIRLVRPDYTITPEDEAQRKERRQISQTARDNMFHFLHFSASLKEESPTPEQIANPKSYTHMARGFDMLFDFNIGPEAEAHNQKIKKLFMMDGTDAYVDSTIEERTEVMKEFIDRQLQTDFSKLFHLSDRELAENFPKLYPLYVLTMEGGDGFASKNGKDYNLPQEYQEKLTALKERNQGAFSDMKARFEAIANPNYEIFHYERMHSKNSAESHTMADQLTEPLAFEYEDRPEELKEDLARFKTYDRLAKDETARSVYGAMMNMEVLNGLGGAVDKVNEHIRKLNIPEDQFQKPYHEFRSLVVPPLLEVKRADDSAIPNEELMNGDLLYFVNPMDQKKHFLKSNGITMEEIDITRLPDPLRTEPDRLMKMLEDANPWRIRTFTSSEEFNEMQKALRDVQVLKETLGPDPSREKKEALNKALDKLQQKAEKYVDYKGGDATRYTKESERARINVGKALAKFAKEGKTLLDAHNQLHDMTWTMELNEAAIKEEQDFQLDLKLSDHYQALDDPMFKLGNGIYDSISAAGKELPENPLDLMARMVAYDLVMRERIAKKDGEPHTIENMFIKNPKDFVNGLKESEALKKAAEGMDKDKFHQLVNQATSANGIQPLTSQVLAEQAQKQARQMANNQPQIQVQSIQNQAIEARKPSQTSLAK